MSISFNPLTLQQVHQPRLPLQLWAPVILIALLVISVTLSSVSKVEILANTKGKVIPSGEIKLVNSPVSAVVKNVLVKNGQLIKKGRSLVHLDLEAEQSELEGISETLTITNAQLNSIQPLLDISTINLPAKISDHMADILSVGIEHQVTRNRFSLLVDELANQEEAVVIKEVKIKQQSLLNARKQVELDYQKELLTMNKTLHSKGFSSRQEQKKLQYELEELELDIAAGKQTIVQILAEIDSIKSDKKQVVNQFRHEVSARYQELKQAQAQLISQQEVLTKRLRYRDIISPYSGYVEDVQVTTVGSFVASGETLLKIVPMEDQKIMEIMIPNKEAGFVQKGNKVRVKFDAYTYTRYGSVEGEVIYLFRDANKIDEQYIYKAYVSLSQAHLTIDQHKHEISHGMTAQADIITGQRSILSYFTDPILNGIDQALIER
ncbi:HlyD family type I secretion periplasmic adaptor subunit [Photobacterium sanguinicancri]|uniref:HlyD family type I secretion periplasmic adaptor subunit n=1 Tax=Photobacterium sanguinicancri TaxID=875932 RepID=UPI0026E20EFA|nr:HlyD family type I secretion periplasmic adaptor subunit [Photobacterium sanguinicancri]MDO6498218.1 HlyD family type I secretion periplasmic adaptor subunit [Photobacterium sanguinicancri]